MRSIAAGLIVVASTLLAGCGVDGAEACDQAMAEFGPTLGQLGTEIADEGDVIGELTCDTDGDPVTWLWVDFVHRAEPPDMDQIGARLAQSGWRRDESLDDELSAGFSGGEAGFTAEITTHTEGTLSVVFTSPRWSPDD